MANYLRNLQPIPKPTKVRGINKTKINAEANLRLDKIYENYPSFCELKFTGCNNLFIARAHRKKRRFYKTVEELASFYETVLACEHCHTILDDRSQTTQEESDAIFKRLRAKA